MFHNCLSEREAVYCQDLINDLKNIQWIKPLIKKIEQNGGISENNKPFLFELRFAADLHYQGLSPEYEYKANTKNKSSIDFKIQNSNFSYLIELLSINASDATKKATKINDIISNTYKKKHKIETWSICLSPNAQDKKQSEEEKIILVQYKILKKLRKFSSVSKNSFNLILIDIRSFLIGSGGDRDDYREIAYGAFGLMSGNSYKRHFVRNDKGEKFAIRGLFEKDNPLRGAKNLQKKIHFLGFINEKTCGIKSIDDEVYGKGKLLKNIYWLPNPISLNNNEYKEVMKKIPFGNHLKGNNYDSKKY